MTENELGALAAKLEELLTFFGYNVAVTPEQHGHTVQLNIETTDGARLIGHRGETLAALQHIMNSMHQESDEKYYIVVDVAGYKAARADRLAEKVKQDAKKVIESGEPHRLRPMNAAERRVVHMALADIDGVATESEGEGRDRRVVIVPA
jgi:spoIIIJ-associated protein